MLIPFQSKASADFLMMEAHVRTLFALMDKPFAPQGVFAAIEVSGYLLRLRAALDAVPSLNSAAKTKALSDANSPDLQDEDPAAAPAVGLKQRAWPLLDMLGKAAQKQHDVTWGTV